MSLGQRLENLDNGTNNAQDNVEKENEEQLPGSGWGLEYHVREHGIYPVDDGDL